MSEPNEVTIPIQVVTARNSDYTPAVGILLSSDSIIEDPNGEPFPGLVLTPWQARRVAYALLFVAEGMEHGQACESPLNFHAGGVVKEARNG